MKILKPLLILIVVVVLAMLFTPPEFRDGYVFYAYGRILELTSGPGKAAQAFKTSSEAMPDNARFVRTYLRALNDVGEDTETESYFVTAYNVASDWIDNHENHDQLWQIYIEMARAEWGRGRKSSAAIVINQAVDLMPTDYVALVYQGIIYRDIRPDNFESVRRSIPIFEQAIEVRRSTRTYWAHYELARAWWMVRDEVRALNELNQALSQYPPRWIRLEAERLKHEIQSSGRSER